jgi:hypothetical protein
MTTQKIMVIDDTIGVKVITSKTENLLWNGRHTQILLPEIEKHDYIFYPNPNKEPLIDKINDKLMQLNVNKSKDYSTVIFFD